MTYNHRYPKLQKEIKSTLQYNTRIFYNLTDSAFPNMASLRYKDENNKHLHHVLCHEETTRKIILIFTMTKRLETRI